MPKFNLLILLIGGLLLSIVNVLGYYLNGYTPIVFVLWLVSIILCGLYFYISEKKENKKIRVFDLEDLLIILILFLAFALLYLTFLYYIPFQINTDELVVTSNAKSYVHQSYIDVLGISPHFGFPNFIFLLWGWLAQLMGDINLFNIRFINGVCGLIIIALSYLFFRTLSLSKTYSVGGAIIMGSQHALLVLSRVAMFNNTALLIELASLSLLYIGWRHRSLFYTFLGGVVAGFSFYVYPVARVIFIVWLFFLTISYLLIWSKQQRQVVFKFFLVGMVSFLFVIAPMIFSSSKMPQYSLSFQKARFIVFSEGREWQRQWVNASSIEEGIKKNISNGLFMFVKNLSDQGNIYIGRYNYGFLDPLTRVLMWLGVFIVILKLTLQKQLKTKEQDLLVLSSFLFLWLFFTFLTVQNPNFTRLLIILPFIIYLVLAAIKKIIHISSKILEKLFRRDKLSLLTKISFSLFCFIVISVVLWNLIIYKDGIIIGFQNGDNIGGTWHYVESQKNISQYTFLLAADKLYPYYYWGNPEGWRLWIKVFTTDNQKVEIINPQDLFSLEKVVAICPNTPFTLFLSQTLYFKVKDNLAIACQPYRVYNIKPDGSLLALDFFE